MNPQERLRMVQTSVQAPWFSFMNLVILTTMALLPNDCETVTHFNRVILTSTYLISMVEMVLNIWTARGLWRQEDCLRDNWNKLHLVMLGAETVSYILCVFGYDWRFSCTLTIIRVIISDKGTIFRRVLINFWNLFPFIMIIIVFKIIIYYPQILTE